MLNLSSAVTALRLAFCSIFVPLFLCALCAPANASLIGDSVTAELSSPNGILSDSTPIDATDTVTVVNPGIEISPAVSSSNIGTFMLTGATAQESIDFQAFDIVVTILAGDSLPNGTPVTGYATGARYIFSSLDIAGSTITGLSVSGSGHFQNFTPTWATLDNPNQLSLSLDQIQFATGVTGTDFGVVTIDLVTTPNGGGPGLPEPGSIALVALALLTLSWAQRRRGRCS